MRRELMKKFLLKKEIERHLRIIKKEEEYEIKKNKNIFFLRKQTSDYEVFRQIFIENEYDIKVEKNPRIILDCGANIGLASLFFNIKFPEAKIIAMEPEESNFKLLCRNTEKVENISVIKAGLWKKKSKLKVKDIGLGKFGFIVEETEEEGIVAESIPSLLEKYNINFIDILKIDIEGSEKEVFEENVEWLKNVGILIIELHDRMKDGCSKTFFKALSLFDYKLSILGENIVIYFNHTND